jgi:hypothetical protein
MIGLVFVLTSFVSANPYQEIESELSNYFEIEFDTNTYGLINFASLNGDELTLNLNNKSMIINTRSFWYEEVNLNVNVENSSILINIKNNDGNILIKQIKDEVLYIYYNKPPLTLIEDNIPVVYVVEHYVPDKKISDSSRIKGTKRLTTVVSNAIVEVDNGLKVRTDGLKIGTRSFFETSNFEGHQIDFIKKNTLTELFGEVKSLVARFFEEFEIREEYDRGYTSNNENVKDISAEFVSPEISGVCDRLGFVYFPGYDYEFIDQTNNFTTNKGYTLGVAYSKYDDYEEALIDMDRFLKFSTYYNLTPIVRVAGQNWYTQVMDKQNVIDFIKDLKEKNNDLELVQIWDKPNMVYEDNNYFQDPINYANYVYEIRQGLNETDVKIISASLSLGPYEQTGDNIKLDSITYFDKLITNQNFLNSIDFWASSSYEINDTKINCITGQNIYSGEELCVDSVNAYKWELEQIKNKTGRYYEVILTDVGYPTSTFTNINKTVELLETINQDLNVKAALLFLGNGWDVFTDSTWINPQTMKLNSFAKTVSKDVCSK